MLRDAFKAYNGQRFDSQGLRAVIIKIRTDNLSILPAEMGRGDLICFARRQGWLREGDDGKVEVVVPQ